MNEVREKKTKKIQVVRVKNKDSHPGSESEPSPAQPEAGDPMDLIPEDANDRFIGRTVGNCKVQTKMNEGGSAYIYKALNLNFGLVRVVKILKQSLVDEQDYFQRFKQEAQLTARLDHPNILKVYDTGEVDRQFFIEMEFVEGQNLRHHMTSRFRLRESEILRIASQIVEALDYAHNAKMVAPDETVIKGILHRDIKPENIMITPGKAAKLMDFGAAKPLSVRSLTTEGSIVGTPYYMSPEQLSGKDIDARSDFFSLGVLLYEMFTGRLPFEADNYPALVYKIDECKFEKIRKLRPSISPHAEELIERLLSKNPDHRPSSAKEIGESLQIALHAQESWAAGNKVKIPFSWRRAYPTLALGISLAALAVSGISYRHMSRTLEKGIVSPAYLDSQLRPMLNKAVELEMAGNHAEALELYALFQPPEQGGERDIYLESQIRMAAIYGNQTNQLTRARSILERLKIQYNDPAVDAYLGQLYFKLALYIEAKERFDSSFASTIPTVLRNSIRFNPHVFTRNAYYTYAESLDRHYVFVDKKPEYLDQAVEAYNRFLSFAGCAEGEDKRCAAAEVRLAELEALKPNPENPEPLPPL